MRRYGDPHALSARYLMAVVVKDHRLNPNRHDEGYVDGMTTSIDRIKSRMVAMVRLLVKKKTSERH